MDVRKVLVTTDFSDAGNAALRVGHDLAKRYEAHLTLLYVQEGKRSIADGVLPHTSHGKAIDRSTTLQNHLEMVAEQLQAEADEYAVLTDTSPTEGILAFAEAEKIDVIVIAARGHSALERLLIGSVTERVVRHAKCAVLTVKPE